MVSIFDADTISYHTLNINDRANFHLIRSLLFAIVQVFSSNTDKFKPLIIFGGEVLGDADVRGLEVAVDDLLFMEVMHGVDELPKDQI
jgi:hypothetical protein